jgi:xenotropic and polytropic retrovirus receptor 1
LRSEVAANGGSEGTTYGSMLSMPALKSVPIGPPSLELPDPALSLSDPLARTRASLEREQPPPNIRRAASTAGDAYEVGRTHTPSKLAVGELPKRRNIFHPRRVFTSPYGGANTRPPFFRRFRSGHHGETPQDPEFPREAYAHFDLAQARFFNFLDKELEKIESFYRMKEEEATERLEKLHEQLRIMRDRRVHELLAAQQHESRRDESEPQENGQKQRPSIIPLQNNTIEAGREWLGSTVGFGNIGKNSKALQDMVAAKQRGEDPNQPADQGWRDYSRRPITEDVPYRIAKRKLKVALQEYYRGLELLKSYALLNRTAFRKINKKYDKAVMARPPYRFMSERVNKSWFVVSERLERMIVEAEDLYARYFERGNHKVAVNKLRSKYGKGSYSSSVFRNGIMLAAGLILAVQGTVNGFYINTDPSDLTKGLWTSYLLQVCWQLGKQSDANLEALWWIFPCPPTLPILCLGLPAMGNV